MTAADKIKKTLRKGTLAVVLAFTTVAGVAQTGVMSNPSSDAGKRNVDPVEMSTVELSTVEFTNDNVESQSEYSKRIKRLTEYFNSLAKNDPNIVMMDRDFFQLNLALQQIPDNDVNAKEKLISQYIQSRIGKNIDPSRFDWPGYAMTDDLTSGEGYTWPQNQGPTRGMGDDGACIVFGALADIDAKSHVQFLTGVTSPLHPDLNNQKLLNIPNVKDFYRVVDYHETGHCLYERKDGDPSTTMQEAVLRRHRSEMYSDVFAALLMARNDGVTNFAEKMARLRLTGEALNGPLFARYARPGSYQYYSPFMYTVHDGSRAAQKEIDALGKSGLKKMSFDEIRALAHKIVDENALGAKEMTTVMMLLRDEFKTENLEKLVQKDPSYQAAYDYALRLKADMSAAVPKVVEMPKVDGRRLTLEELKFDYDAFFAPRKNSSAEAAIRQQAIVNVLKDRLIWMAGGEKATNESLIKAFSKHKDFLRKVLRKGTESQRQSAMEFLPAMTEAVKLAAIQINGDKTKVATVVAPTVNFKAVF